MNERRTVDTLGDIERWTIWHTPGTTPGTHKSYVEGPVAGDWAEQGVEVVPAEHLRGAVEALREIADRPYRGGTGPSQKARAALAGGQ